MHISVWSIGQVDSWTAEVLVRGDGESVYKVSWKRQVSSEDVWVGSIGSNGIIGL